MSLSGLAFPAVPSWCLLPARLACLPARRTLFGRLPIGMDWGVRYLARRHPDAPRG
ncbi:MAG: hypothetical protein MZV63_07265 [Marinilabiliales bacterium]|nr:hypothetical protein [Marinilabiliales bacterium]